MSASHALVADATSFDWRNAHLLARAAEVAYLDKAGVEREVLDDWQFEQCEFFDEEDTQAFVAASGPAVIVSFRGTETNRLADLLTDANTSLIAGPFGGRVHAGFYEALSHVWRLLDECVRDLSAGEQKYVFVTGHSLGGALAALATARWVEAKQNVQGMYTFGQPRTGDHTFARNFNFAFRPRAFRLVNNNDLVPRIPPKFWGYRHLGVMKYFAEEGDLPCELTWWRFCLDRWRGRVEKLIQGAIDDLQDHSMLAYLSQVAQAAAAEPAAEIYSLEDYRPQPPVRSRAA